MLVNVNGYVHTTYIIVSYFNIILQHHNSSRRLEFSDDSSGATYNSVLGSSDEEEVEGSGEVSGRERKGRGGIYRRWLSQGGMGES